MKVNLKCVQSMCIVVLLLLSACSNADPETTERLTGPFPDLYNAVFDRDVQALLTFTSSDDPVVAEQAWNALISTPADSLELLFEAAASANTRSAWASLWFRELNSDQLDMMEQRWMNEPGLRSGLATVLGYHGDAETLKMLLNEGPDDLPTALAIGRISGRADLSPELEMSVAEHAFESEDDPRKAQAYLYGFYRSRRDLQPETEQWMLEAWENFYPEGNKAEQYLAGILMKNHMDAVIFRYEMNDYEWMEPVMAIEMARNIARYPLTRQSTAVLNAMLDNRNPNVRIEALKAIEAQQESLQGRHDRAVLNKLGLIRGYQPALRLQAMAAISEPGTYDTEIHELTKEDPFLQQTRFRIQSRYLAPDSLLAQMRVNLNKEDRLFTVFTVQALSEWWSGLDESIKTAHAEQVRTMVLELMETDDRSVVYSLTQLLEDPMLLVDDEADRIFAMLERFTLPEDVEVFQSVSGVLSDRFRAESEDYIMELAQQGNTALNNTLAGLGWDIVVSESRGTPDFRVPDWKKLTRLGDDPILVIDTEKGIIRLRLNTLKAPATIAGMDSLIRAGAYNYIPFHRVIPNFVVQGGDVESQDGFGGPDYIVPTEATPQQYARGMVGIASAGTDTEGSQFFIMHDWMPHLNGRYTIIGEVIEGMDVVDRIVRGDYVKRMRWQ